MLLSRRASPGTASLWPKLPVIGVFLIACLPVWAQQAYRKPPLEIAKILEAPRLPAVSVAPNRRFVLFVHRTSLPSVRDLARPVLALAGVRLNPQTNGRYSPPRYKGLSVRDLETGERLAVSLPRGVDIGWPKWSPDGARFAFTVSSENGIELWVAEAQGGSARRVIGPSLNGALGDAFAWMPDSRRILCRLVPEDRGRPPERPVVPRGPVIMETASRAGAVRTYRDLLSDVHDEALLDYFMSAQLALVDGVTGERTHIGTPAIYDAVHPSPSGEFLLVSRTVRPYSSLVTVESFPRVVEIWDAEGALVRELARLPLREPASVAEVPRGPRAAHWRPSALATVAWVEAVEPVNSQGKGEYRDRIMMLRAPFGSVPKEAFRTEHQFSGIDWLEQAELALVNEYDPERQWRRTWLVNVDLPRQRRLVWSRSVNDHYTDPGRPLTTSGSSDRALVKVNNGFIYLAGRGASPKGERPFLDRFNLSTLNAERLWQCQGESYETVVDLLSENASLLLTRYETRTDPPNYFIRDLRDGSRRQVTALSDPAPLFRDVRTELVKYRRDDGVQLSATLHLPANFREGQRLPLILWAYPEKYTDPVTAGQVSGSPYRFIYIEEAFHLLLATEGYAVMDAAAMPVIGEGDSRNDTFVEQIVAAARAAMDKAVAMGIADPNRVGVGGHSYGAFMVANLLAHSDLFKAGIAQSGAYNRTLTPFGFQNEQRTLWDAPTTYLKVSPFMYANQINEPLLLIHGESDDNAGTLPLQSERLYHAIRGHGGHVKLVMLPLESHVYRAKESILHSLTETIEWFDLHVRGAPKLEPRKLVSASLDIAGQSDLPPLQSRSVR